MTIPQLEQWLDEGLITAEQAVAIEQYEATRVAPAPRPPRRSGVIAEVVGSLGALAAAIAAVVGTSVLWDELTTFARVAVPVVGAVALLGAGGAVPRSGEASITGLGALLWLLGTAATAAAVAVVVVELTELADQNVVLLTGVAALGLSLVLAHLRPSAHLVGAVTGGIVLVAVGVVGQYDCATPAQYGAALITVGLAVMLFGWADVLGSPGAAYLFGGATAFVGTEMLGDLADHWPVVAGRLAYLTWDEQTAQYCLTVQDLGETPKALSCGFEGGIEIGEQYDVWPQWMGWDDQGHLLVALYEPRGEGVIVLITLDADTGYELTREELPTDTRPPDPTRRHDGARVGTTWSDDGTAEVWVREADGERRVLLRQRGPTATRSCRASGRCEATSSWCKTASGAGSWSRHRVILHPGCCSTAKGARSSSWRGTSRHEPTRSLLDELDQGAEAALGVDERHGGAPATRAGRLVDGGRSRRHHGGERLGAVAHPVADVVEALTALVDRLGHRAVVAGRGEQLDVALGHLQQRLFDTVGLDDLTVVDLGPEGPAVIVDSGLEVANGDGHVVDLSQQHGHILPWRLPGRHPRRNSRSLSSPILSRSSWSSMPRPSWGARHSTPSLPSCML